MANFDYPNSAARKAWLRQRVFGSVFLVLTIFNLMLLGLAVFLLFQAEAVLAGLGQILLGLALLLQSYYLSAKFTRTTMKTNNLADRFSLNLIELMEKIMAAGRIEGVAELSPEYFFEKFSLTREGKIIALRLGLPFSRVEKGQGLKSNPKISADFITIVTKINSGPAEIQIEDILAQIIETSTSVQTYLREMKLVPEDITIVLNWAKELKKSLARPRFWQPSPLTAGIGQEWSYGYTPVLSLYSRDLSIYFQDPTTEINIFGHTNKLTDIQNILAKPSKNNCMLVGDPGVGKKTIVNALAAKFAQGDCLAPLKYKRIRQIDIGRLLAGGTKSDLVGRIQRSLSEAINAGNIIIFIDNFQSLLGGGVAGAEEVGGVDASQVLLPFLENSGLRIIATITPDDYFRRVRNNPGLAAAFEKINVAPASASDTLNILLESISLIEYKYNCFIPFQTLKTIVKLSDRYIHDVPFPEKALRLLEEGAVNFSGRELKIITPEDMEGLIAKKAGVPIGQAGVQEKERLLNLETYLHARVIGQDEAIKAVADTLRRVRAGITTGKRPAGVFLFLGPTGVGKTETAKALAETYFGSEKQMIRLDMSEYQQPSSIDRLIGSTNNPSGILTDAIFANPFSLILLDEIEKADKNVINVFLQVFEDGRLTDARGRTSDFTNSIIIATSNAGSELIRQKVQAGQATNLHDELINALQTQGIFTPEFINRFDGAIVFKPLTTDQIRAVARLMIQSINKTLADKRIVIEVMPDALDKLVELGYDPQFGARPMRRVIQQKIENLLAKKMLEGTVEEGQTLNITLNDINT